MATALRCEKGRMTTRMGTERTLAAARDGHDGCARWHRAKAGAAVRDELPSESSGLREHVDIVQDGGRKWYDSSWKNRRR